MTSGGLLDRYVLAFDTFYVDWHEISFHIRPKKQALAESQTSTSNYALQPIVFENFRDMILGGAAEVISPVSVRLEGDKVEEMEKLGYTLVCNS